MIKSEPVSSLESESEDIKPEFTMITASTTLIESFDSDPMVSNGLRWAKWIKD